MKNTYRKIIRVPEAAYFLGLSPDRFRNNAKNGKYKYVEMEPYINPGRKKASCRILPKLFFEETQTSWEDIFELRKQRLEHKMHEEKESQLIAH